MLEQTLSGIQVIEVATYVPGPVCTQILRGLGAEVTKVSRPGGDPLRNLPPLDAAYELFNAGKREIEVDLRSAAGAATLRDLVLGADILVDGLRPGALERMGLGASMLHGLNPRLIYCALSGYGLSGADRERAGHDLDFVARSGLLATTAVGGVPALPGTQLADMVTGLTAVTAILAALQARERSGVGGILDVSMLGATRWLMTPWYEVARLRPGAEPLNGNQACYRVYRTADGRYLAVAALEAHFWGRFCQALGRPELVARQHDADQAALAAALAATIAERPFAEWHQIFADLDACVSPVLTVEEAAADGVVSISLPVTSRGR
jgi:crotonobetainyl-CoA:carnitine CoA-transferase CaiB-like acyl-CoA transferase